MFLLLTVFVGRNHVFPWTHEAYPVPEKAIYFGSTFFTIRVLAVFAIITLLSVWYIYTSLRLDVGMNPEWKGAGWAEGIRARMRRGFRDERREIHSTHSLQGKLAVYPLSGVRLRVVDAGVGPVDGPLAPLPEHTVRLVVLHGRVA